MNAMSGEPSYISLDLTFAHCASVERTLTSSLTGYEYLGLDK